MQPLFSVVPETFNEIKFHVSAPRLTTYSRLANGDEQRGLRLYRWNCALSQSLYWPLQCAEVSTRNAIARILIARYGQQWHQERKFRAALERGDLYRLDEVIGQLAEDARGKQPHADAVTAALPMGFWLSMLGNRYAVPFGWATRLRTAFPHLPAGYGRESVYGPLNRIRIFRNRVAHHEPICHLPLEMRYREICSLIEWASPATLWWVQQSCSFREVFGNRPAF